MVIVLAAGAVGFAIVRFLAPIGHSSAVNAMASTALASASAAVAPLPRISPGHSASSHPEQRKGAVPWSEMMKGVGSHDPFASAAKLWQFLESLSAEDFRRLQEKPEDLAIPSSYGFDQEFSQSFMDALIERWFEVDPERALEGIRNLASGKQGHPPRNDELGAALARVKPRMVVEALREKGAWDRSDGSVLTAFERMARSDANMARQYVHLLKDPEQRKAAESAIARGVADVDPLAALDLARTMDDQSVFNSAMQAAERIGPGMLRRLLAANEGRFETAQVLPELMLKYPGEDLQEFLDPKTQYSPGMSMTGIDCAKRMTTAERETLLAKLEGTPEGARNKMTEAVLFGWARQDPRAATEWALAHAKPNDGTAAETKQVGAAFFHWLHTDRENAFGWWSQLRDSPLRQQLGNGIASLYAADGRVDEALALFRPEVGSDPSDSIVQLAYVSAKRDPGAAAQWLDGLPDAVGFEKAAAQVLEQWLERDATAAARWVESQPTGARRDAAFSAYARQAAELDAAAAGEWAAKITDAKIRKTALEVVYREMRQEDPPGARSWIRSVEGVDPAWRERLIRY